MYREWPFFQSTIDLIEMVTTLTHGAANLIGVQMSCPSTHERDSDSAAKTHASCHTPSGQTLDPACLTLLSETAPWRL